MKLPVEYGRVHVERADGSVGEVTVNWPLGILMLRRILNEWGFYPDRYRAATLTLTLEEPIFLQPSLEDAEAALRSQPAETAG